MMESMADLTLEQRNAALVAWLNDLTTVYEKCAAERDALLKLCKDAEDALSWPQSFYNDVTNTAPEYIERCGDWNAIQYMLQDCANVRQRLRATVAQQEGSKR